MSATRSLSAERGAPAHLARHRLRLADGAATTLHVATYDAAATAVGVVLLPRPMALAAWCAAHGVQEAIVGGFFARPTHARPDGTRPSAAEAAGADAVVPLGELRTHGVPRRHVPFTAPWDARRSALHVEGDRATLAPRDELPALPRGDLLQAGPLLVRDGEPCVPDDPEGFSSGAGQFDSDITVGRYPRAALATCVDGRLLAVACDGRAESEAGLTFRELAETLARMGADRALNLDGGGSTSLVCAGRLRNVPRAEHAVPLPGGRPIATAITFAVRDRT
jgi:hypothetical protein